MCLHSQRTTVNALCLRVCRLPPLRNLANKRTMQYLLTPHELIQLTLTVGECKVNFTDKMNIMNGLVITNKNMLRTKIGQKTGKGSRHAALYSQQLGIYEPSLLHHISNISKIMKCGY